MSQKRKEQQVYERLWEYYVHAGVFKKDGPLISFTHENTDAGYKITEIFRNADGAEFYYTTFMKNKCNMIRILFNLPWRQLGVSEILYGNPDEIKKSEQLMKYIPAKLEGTEAKGRPFVKWEKPPSRADLEEQFGKFHFGFTDRGSLAEVDPVELQDKPRQQAMRAAEEAPKDE